MRVVAWDTETRGLDFFDPEHAAFLATWADESGEYVADLAKPDEVNAFIAALKSADVLVGHNSKFDVHHVRAATGFDILSLGVPIHDTDLLSRVLHPEGQRGTDSGHGLKDLAKVYLRADADDEAKQIAEMAKAIGLRTIKQTGAFYDVWRAYPDVMEGYALMDARYTFDLFQKFEPQLQDLRRVYELEMAVAPILMRAETRGVALDRGACNTLKARFEAELAEVEEYLLGELGEQALGGEGSDQALIDALLRIGVPLYRKTDTGQIATNVFALQEFENDFEQLAKLSEMRRLRKFLATYIGAMHDRDTVHPSFWQLGAWTSRMSCSRPNFQNLPKRAGKEVRSILVPRPGHAFVVSDYESIESKLLAYYLGNDDYRQMFRDGHDVHAWMAAQIHGGTMEMYAKGTPGEALRDEAKNTTFAISYGAGGKRVTDMNKLDPGPYWAEDHPAILAAREQGRDWPKAGYQYREARALIAKIKSSLPGFHALNKRIRNKIENQGCVNTIIGRRQVVSKDKGHVGLNALIQGTAAEILKIGLVNVDRAIAPLGGTVLLLIHDEILSEVPIEHAEECQRRQDAAMCDMSSLPVVLDPPLTVESSIVTTSYADA